MTGLQQSCEPMGLSRLQLHHTCLLSHVQVAFHFVPSRETFMEKVAGTNDPEALQQMRSFIDNFSPLLAEVHKFLVSTQSLQRRGSWFAGDVSSTV